MANVQLSQAKRYSSDKTEGTLFRVTFYSGCYFSIYLGTPMSVIPNTQPDQPIEQRQTIINIINEFSKTISTVVTIICMSQRVPQGRPTRYLSISNQPLRDQLS